MALRGLSKARDPFNLSVNTGVWSAVIARLGEAVADPNALASLQQRLNAHGAEVSGQVPELLLRASDPEAAVSGWLLGKDPSHWRPQAWGGDAADGWSFETASWNRARGAEAMDPVEIGRAQMDGGVDAMSAPGVIGSIGVESLEAALLASAATLAWWLLHNRRELLGAKEDERQDLIQEGFKAVGLAALSGAGSSLVLSVALALIPGGQALLLAGAVVRVSQVLPQAGLDPFSLNAGRIINQ